MKLNHAHANIFVPDAVSVEAALARTTHLCIAAHQDDIELMAYHGIAECFGRSDRWFTGVVVTNGAGSPRSGLYGNHSDEQMQTVRLREQRKAAFIGEYGCQLQLGYSSSAAKDPSRTDLLEDLVEILVASRPQIVYAHNLADKHETHIAVVLRTIAALRSLSGKYRPEKVYGCEMWRGLDWLPDEDKQVLPVSSAPNIAAALVGVFDSQISGGKRYDLAAAGRRLANATYFASHNTDSETALTYAMDLTPLIDDPALSIPGYVGSFVNRLKTDIENQLAKLS